MRKGLRSEGNQWEEWERGVIIPIYLRLKNEELLHSDGFVLAKRAIENLKMVKDQWNSLKRGRISNDSWGRWLALCTGICRGGSWFKIYRPGMDRTLPGLDHISHIWELNTKGTNIKQWRWTKMEEKKEGNLPIWIWIIVVGGGLALVTVFVIFLRL